MKLIYLILYNPFFCTIYANFHHQDLQLIDSLARVAQSVERSAVNRKVGGYPPVSEFLPTKIFYARGAKFHHQDLQLIVSLARVAQSVERSAVNRKVGGSNPPVSEFFTLSKLLPICPKNRFLMRA